MVDWWSSYKVKKQTRWWEIKGERNMKMKFQFNSKHPFEWWWWSNFTGWIECESFILLIIGIGEKKWFFIHGQISFRFSFCFFLEFCSFSKWFIHCLLIECLGFLFVSCSPCVCVCVFSPSNFGQMSQCHAKKMLSMMTMAMIGVKLTNYGP